MHLPDPNYVSFVTAIIAFITAIIGLARLLLEEKFHARGKSNRKAFLKNSFEL